MSTDQNTVATARFTVPYAPLIEALAVVAYGTAAATAATPATACVLIEADETGLTLRTHDWETAVSTTVPEATVTQHGASLLPLDQLKKALAAMVAGETKTTAARTTVTLDGDLLATAHLTVPIDAVPVGEFVPAPKPGPVSAVLDAPALCLQLRRVLPAAGKDDTLPILTGVALTLADQTLTLSATDRYRFAVADIPATSAPARPLDAEPLSALLPASTLTRLAKHLTGTTGPVGIAYGDPGLTLTVGETTLTIRELEGKQPGYASFFPKAVDASATLDRPATLRALKKCTAMITAKGAKLAPVALGWDAHGALTLAPRFGDKTERARTKGVPVEYTTPTPDALLHDYSIHVNPAFLKDALETCDGPTATLHLRRQKPESALIPPMIITSGPDLTGDYRHLLMPVRIS